VTQYACLDPLVDIFDQPRPIDWEKIFGRKAPLEVEIGFGLGEVLLRKASKHSRHNFIGIEENWQRIYKTLKTLTGKEGGSTLSNVKILSHWWTHALLFSDCLLKNL